jgi:hypothetical protein
MHTPDQALEGQWPTCKEKVLWHVPPPWGEYGTSKMHRKVGFMYYDVIVLNDTRLSPRKPTPLGIMHPYHRSESNMLSYGAPGRNNTEPPNSSLPQKAVGTTRPLGVVAPSLGREALSDTIRCRCLPSVGLRPFHRREGPARC